MDDALSIFRHYVHRGVWVDKVVLGREQLSELPNYGCSIADAGVHEYRVSGYINDRSSLQLIHGKVGMESIHA